MVADLSRQWREDGPDADAGPWEALPDDVKIAYLAERTAAQHPVSFERLADAAERILGQEITWTRGALAGAVSLCAGSTSRFGTDPQGLAESETARPPRHEGPPGRGEYQVWHDRDWPQSRINQMLGGWPPSQFPQDYFHAADVHADSLLEAVQLTTGKGHVLEGDHQPWDGHQGVRSYTPKPFVPRDTSEGDVVVDPQGQAHRYDGQGFSEVEATAKPSLPSPAEPAESTEYDSPPETIALARDLMCEIEEALTKDADGHYPASYAGMDWDGMNMQPPETAWQDMDVYERYDLLEHAIDEAIWSLEKRDKEATCHGVRQGRRAAGDAGFPGGYLRRPDDTPGGVRRRVRPAGTY